MSSSLKVHHVSAWLLSSFEGKVTHQGEKHSPNNKSATEARSQVAEAWKFTDPSTICNTEWIIQMSF